MNKLSIIKVSLLITLFVLPFSFTHAESTSGFLNDTIWFSQKSFAEGDSVEIHTAVWNGEASTLSAKVEFTDLNTILGTRNISVPAHTLQDVFITWKVTAGDHTIKANIKNATTIVNGKTSSITLPDSEQSLPKIFISKKITTGSGDDITKTITDKVDSALPENVAKPISKGINSLDNFRVNTEEKIVGLLDNVNKKLVVLNNTTPEEAKATDTKSTDTKTTKTTKTTDTKTADTKPTEVAKKPLSGTEKPIAYVELFLLNVASFIFKTAIAFYLVCAFVLFIIIRFIYKKIRG